jgi:uridylate kinase
MSSEDPSAPPRYRRVVLKLSGESFCHAGERGISMDEVLHIARQTVQAAKRGVQIAIVMGGGNILRGAQFTAGSSSIQEATAHYMGMLATVINGLALQDALELLAAGTGSPFVTTDTAAAQRALELEADILLKATRVDGVFSDDPEKNPHAILYRELSYQAMREQNLRVMDPTAVAQCMEHNMPILVFNFKKERNIERAVNGERVGTIIGARD